MDRTEMGVIAEIATHAATEAFSAMFRVVGALPGGHKTVAMAMAIAVMQDKIDDAREVIKGMVPELDATIDEALTRFKSHGAEQRG